MRRLALLCHRVVWLNPHHRSGGRAVPSSLGMAVAGPHVDLILSGHSLAALEDFAAVLPTLD
jgi:uncharacterized protein with von Willebrand factor type A (vWA) domain